MECVEWLISQAPVALRASLAWTESRGPEHGCGHGNQTDFLIVGGFSWLVGIFF